MKPIAGAVFADRLSTFQARMEKPQQTATSAASGDRYIIA